MCCDPYLFHLSLSPPQLISLHPHLFISPYFLPHRFWGRKGRGWERGAAVWHQLARIFYPSLSMWLFVLNTHMSLHWHILVIPYNPLASHLWLLRFMNPPACMSTLTDMSHISMFTSAFFFIWVLTHAVFSHSAIYSPYGLCIISLFLYCFVLALESCHFMMLKHDREWGRVIRLSSAAWLNVEH